MKFLVDTIERILGRHTTCRLGRALYSKGRADSPNNIQSNGEGLLQRCLVNRFSETQEKLVVFDVGANIGDWTLSLLNEVEKRNMESPLEVHAFEPAPSTFIILKDRVSRHQLEAAVHFVPQALSNKDGTADIYISGENAGINSLHVDQLKQTLPRVQIETITGSTYCANNHVEIIHFLKCDTEGHDMEVLIGSKKLFDEQRIMACQFEYNYRWVYSRHYLKDVFDLFQDTPYSIGKVTPNRIELYQEWHPELECFLEGNFTLLHAKALDWFPTITGKHDKYNIYVGQDDC